jgi:hypothetical protein
MSVQPLVQDPDHVIETVGTADGGESLTAARQRRGRQEHGGRRGQAAPQGASAEPRRIAGRASAVLLSRSARVAGRGPAAAAPGRPQAEASVAPPPSSRRAGSSAVQERLNWLYALPCAVTNVCSHSIGMELFRRVGILLHAVFAAGASCFDTRVRVEVALPATPWTVWAA